MKIGLIDTKRRTYTSPDTFIEPMEAECIMGTSLDFDPTEPTEEALSNEIYGDWGVKQGLWDEDE